jgi:hypothetical protein
MVSVGQNPYDAAYEKWGRYCNICRTSLGLQIDHIDGNHDNNDLANLIPLCASCHQEKTNGNYIIDPGTREVTVGFSPYCRLAPGAAQPSARVAAQVAAFYREFREVPQRADNAKLALAQDKVDGVFFVDCHLRGDDIAGKLDSRARLRILEGDDASREEPEDEEAADAQEAEEDETYAEFGFNREIQDRHPVFRRMVEDALGGRSFLGMVLEWDQFYTADRPLKILGGQHRCEAVKRAIERGEESDRFHSVRIHFGLNAEQQAQIIDIYNANIDVPKALWDRIGEQLLGDSSRAWCQRVGLLGPDENFTDKASQRQPMTVQILRCLVVNYFRGRGFSGDFEGDGAKFLEDIDIMPTGSMEPNEAYKALATQQSTWTDADFEDAGREFARLHQRQKQVCLSTSGMARFQNKTLTPAVVAGWAYAAALLADRPDRLSLLFRLADNHDRRVSPDPLNAAFMSRYSHDKDDATYRGLGTRQNKAEAQKLAYVFLAHSNPNMTRNGLQQQIVDYAIGEYYRLVGRRRQQEEEARQAELRKRLERRE